MPPDQPAPAHLGSATAVRPRTPWAWALGTFFGAGLLRPGPGTWGSVAALLLWLAAAYGFHASPGELTLLTSGGAMLAIALGIPAATIVEMESGREDPGEVVIDEVAGQWIALLPCSWPESRHLFPFSAPVGAHFGPAHADWLHALLALLLFRAFDIVKPPPARQLERLHGGTGIMLDDVAAGIYAALCVWVICALTR